MHVLVVEDDSKISDFLKRGFGELGYRVDLCDNGESALSMMNAQNFDAVVLDIMMPKLGGLEVLETVRKGGSQVPVLILSARQTVDDRVSGLNLGADDFLTKPFSFAELVARLNSMTRRRMAAGQAAAHSTLGYEDIKLDLVRREVIRGEKKVELFPKEFLLLEYFLSNPERVLSKTMILDRIWGYDFDPQTNVVDVLVCRLRNKIDKDFPVKLIHTHRGVGYVLKKIQ